MRFRSRHHDVFIKLKRHVELQKIVDTEVNVDEIIKRHYKTK